MAEHRLKTPQVQAPEEPAGPKATDTIRKPEIPENNDSKASLYTLDYLQFKGWGEIMLEPKLDVYGAKEKILGIESFIEGYITRNGLKNDYETFSGILRQMEKRIGVTGLHQQEKRVERLHRMIKALKEDENRKTKMRQFVKKANEESLKIKLNSGER